MAVFTLADPEGTGTVGLDEMRSVLASLDVRLSAIQTDILLSEVSVDGTGHIKYVASIPVLVDLLHFCVGRVKETHMRQMEEVAYLRAHDICLASEAELYAITSYLYEGCLEIDRTIDVHDTAGRYVAIRALVESPHSGLAQTEATHLLANLYTADPQPYSPYSQHADHAHLTHARPGSGRLAGIRPHHAAAHPSQAQRRREKIAWQANVAKQQHSRKTYYGAPVGSHTRVMSTAAGASSSIPPRRCKPDNGNQSRLLQDTPLRSLEETTNAVFDARKLTSLRGILQVPASTAYTNTLFK